MKTKKKLKKEKKETCASVFFSSSKRLKFQLNEARLRIQQKCKILKIPSLFIPL